MQLKLSKQEMDAAVSALEQFYNDTMDAPIGNLAAAELIAFFVREVGPCLYNQGIASAQAHMLTRVSDLDQDLNLTPFSAWQAPPPRRGRS